MKLENCHVAEINVFCPQADENVYLAWFEARPEEQANGPLFQFDVMLDYDTEDFYVAANGTVAQFEAVAYDFAPTSGLNSLKKKMSETLEIDEDISGKVIFFIDALLSDEGSDLDESGMYFRWVNFPNAFCRVYLMRKPLRLSCIPEKQFAILVLSHNSRFLALFIF